jgi:3-hydroxyisobutyrate dehydrogenase-like beta-hydroxyacid dehydrogenase
MTAIDSATTKTSPVGLIGLGLIGTAVAHRLLGSGYRVLGYDIDAEKRAAFAKLGGQPAESLSQIAQNVETMLTCVFDTDQTEDVVENAIAPAMPAGARRTVLAVSTCDPDRIAALAARVAHRGIRLMDTPVSGSSKSVQLGKGLALIGGEAADVATVKDVLDAVFPDRRHVGPVGNGGRAKLAINLIAGLNRLVVAEGLVFAEKMGLEPETFLQIAKDAASYSAAMEEKGRKMVTGDFAPLGRARQTLKDVHIMLEQGRRKGQQLPLAALAADVLEACVRHGEGDLDNSIIINEIRRRTSPKA